MADGRYDDIAWLRLVVALVLMMLSALSMFEAAYDVSSATGNWQSACITGHIG